jgi:hypothetical protein
VITATGSVSIAGIHRCEGTRVRNTDISYDSAITPTRVVLADPAAVRAASAPSPTRDRHPTASTTSTAKPDGYNIMNFLPPRADSVASVGDQERRDGVRARSAVSAAQSGIKTTGQALDCRPSQNAGKLTTEQPRRGWRRRHVPVPGRTGNVGEPSKDAVTSAEKYQPPRTIRSTILSRELHPEARRATWYSSTPIP